jgi:hypothetical protein
MSIKDKLKSNWPLDGSILTAGQHLHMAKIIRRGAGKPGYPTKDHAEEMAQGHEQLARMIERRLTKAREAGWPPQS